MYDSSDLRMTLVYRSRCFKSKEDSDKYRRDNIESQSGQLELDDILRTLIKDMVEKKKLPKDTTLESISRFELARAMIKGYSAYPLPSKSKVFFPFNYCMIS